MRICVDSEVGRLEHVIVHKPGDEIIRMTQHQLDELLFDDILSPQETGREHDLMVEILEGTGATVHDIRQLLEKALGRAPKAAVERLLERVGELAGAPALAAAIASWEPARLAAILIEGLYWRELDDPPATLSSLRLMIDDPQSMLLAPLPNLMFMRDPCFSAFDRVVVGRMATEARAREPLLVAFAIRWSDPDGDDDPPLVFHEDDAHRNEVFRQLEGGDALVLSPEVMMIGCSQRTSAQTIERLAEEALFPAHAALQRVYAVMMPEARSVMHLDTILTQIDRELFLGHRPLIAGQGARAALPVARIRRGAPPVRHAGSTLDVLREEFGKNVELVSCGGDDPLHQEREQWTDGANAVCAAPGHILLYARNVRTIETLRGYGFDEIRLSIVQPPEQRRELIESGMAKARVVFSFSGSELSRARGGGRCLTMPLARASI